MIYTARGITDKDNGKTRTVYAPKDLLREVQSWVAEQQRLKNLLSAIHPLTLAPVRNHAPKCKRRQGKP